MSHTDGLKHLETAINDAENWLINRCGRIIDVLTAGIVTAIIWRCMV